ncbi:MAG: hypothetical protein WCB48_00515, partial [Casimicrobiaceae bacterium]
VVVEAGACIAAGAWVDPGTVVPAGWIWAGRPARTFREIKDSERREFARAGEVYVRYASAYRDASSPGSLTAQPKVPAGSEADGGSRS